MEPNYGWSPKKTFDIYTKDSNDYYSLTQTVGRDIGYRFDITDKYLLLINDGWSTEYASGSSGYYSWYYGDGSTPNSTLTLWKSSDAGINWKKTSVDFNAIYTSAVGAITSNTQFGINCRIHPNNKYILITHGQIPAIHIFYNNNNEWSFINTIRPQNFQTSGWNRGFGWSTSTIPGNGRVINWIGDNNEVLMIEEEEENNTTRLHFYRFEPEYEYNKLQISYDSDIVANANIDVNDFTVTSDANVQTVKTSEISNGKILLTIKDRIYDFNTKQQVIQKMQLLIKILKMH